MRSLLASLIIQWESYQEQSTRNISKTLGITLRLLNIINKVIEIQVGKLIIFLNLVKFGKTTILLYSRYIANVEFI